MTRRQRSRSRFSVICLALFGVLFWLSACAITGIGNPKVGDDKEIAKIIQGKSTKQEVEALLGEPAQVIRENPGTEIWKYAYVRKTLHLFFLTEFPLTGDDLKDQEVTIEFNSRGVVRRLAKNISSPQIRGGF